MILQSELKNALQHPQISHCDNPNCLRCNHMALGGPILPPDFWEKGVRL